MTRGRRTLLVVFALVFLAAGGLTWYWQATAVERQVDALLAQVRAEEPGFVERWLRKLGLRKGRRTFWRGDEVTCDLAKLGPSAVPYLIRALRDEDEDVRSVAAVALGKLGDARGVEPRIALLKDPLAVASAATCSFQVCPSRPRPVAAGSASRMASCAPARG